MAYHKTNRGEEGKAYIFLAFPAVIIYLAVIAFPTIFSIYLSMTNFNGGAIFGASMDFVGLKHYLEMFRDPYFWLALKNNVYIILVSVFGQIPIGFALAYVLFRKLVGLQSFFQTMVYLPNTISTIVIGVLFQSFFSPYGAFTQLIQSIDPKFENTLMLHPQLAMIPVLLVILWMYTGYYMIIFLANMQKIDSSIIEATKIDGANEWQTLKYVILPALSGVIVVTAILAISGSLKSFDLIFAMTAGNPARRTSVLSIYMFDNAFRGSPNYPLANAISTFMVFLSLFLIFIIQTIESKFGGRE
ncbi:MAG: sugar ABC transporter permease [Treponemataceae bacterium]|nr:sugar ABC transporter permease [Treponemataceae bacterium]